MLLCILTAPKTQGQEYHYIYDLSMGYITHEIGTVESESTTVKVKESERRKES